MTTHSQKKKLNTVIQFTWTLLLCCMGVFAQHNENSNPQTLQLEELKGFTQTYMYSQGNTERAKNIAKFMERAGDYFQKEIKFTPKITMYILAPHHWKEIAAKPLHDTYGFPHNIDMQRLAIAAEDNPFWQSFLPPLENLSPNMVSQIDIAYGKEDGSHSMMPFFDLLALHELGHSYHSQAGLKMHRKWMVELFVNIMLHTYIAENQPELLPALETFPNMVIELGTAEYKYTSLEDFERLYATLGMGPKNYGWYQSKFHSAAKNIYNAGGKEVLYKLWKALEMHQEEMTDEEFVTMLNSEVHSSVADVILNWNK